MVARTRKAASKALAIASASPAAPAADSFAPAQKADLFKATDGRTEKLAWARYQTPLLGSNGSNPMSVMLGGRLARDSALASYVTSDLAISNATLNAALDVAETNIVSPLGLTLSSKPDAKVLGISPDAARELSHSIETAWKAWSSNPVECDMTGRFDVHSLAAAAVRSCSAGAAPAVDPS